MSRVENPKKKIDGDGGGASLRRPNPSTYNGYTYTWDRGRQLVGVTGPDLVATYEYNAAGQRISKTVKGVTTHFTYAGDLLIRQSDGTAGGTIHFYYDANGELYAMRLHDTVQQFFFYQRNAQGDIVGMNILRSPLNSSYATYAYDALGNHTLETASALVKDNPFRYRGYYYDEETGFYFCQSRYYNPEWRRWLNADAYFIASEVVDDALLTTNMYAYW